MIGNLQSDDEYPTWVGIVGSVIAIFFFGSNFLPVKKFETGDGKCLCKLNTVFL